MTYRTIASAGSASKRPGSYDFSAANVSARSVGRDLDPVITIDHFHIRAPMFAPHPHAGFSAVTYLFEDSDGEFENRDSMGHRIIAHPGAVIWTVTGSGVMHEELPRERGRLSHGVQLFVNLSSKEKLQPPRVLFADGPDVPVVQGNGTRVRVMAGTSGDARGKIEPPGNITFLDIKLDPEATFDQSFPTDLNVLVYVIKGSLRIGDDGRRLGALDAASLASDADSVQLRGSSDGAQALLIAGPPLRERVVSHGPFIMNSEDQIASATTGRSSTAKASSSR